MSSMYVLGLTALRNLCHVLGLTALRRFCHVLGTNLPPTY